ncbi:MAG: hypothetical protein ACI857_001861 [Arenicella sp.]|jgi:hypothetical protein
MKIVNLIICLLSFSVFAQDDLDEMFDDGDKESRFLIGTEILPTITTVPNINFSIGVFDNFVIRPGIGIIPFGIYYDLNNWRPGGQLPILDREVSVGLYYDCLLRYDIKSDLFPADWKLFVFGSYQHWNYNYKDDFTVNRDKGNFGFGNELGLRGKLNAELRFGFMVGRDKFEYHDQESFEEFDQLSERMYSFGYYKNPEQTKLMMFFSFGFGLHYGL